MVMRIESGRDLLQWVCDTFKLHRSDTDSYEKEAANLKVALAYVTAHWYYIQQAAQYTLRNNLDLCDGDDCTLKELKDAVYYANPSFKLYKDEE